MPDLCSNSDPAHFSSIIQELTKEHADSHQHCFFGNPLLSSHITPEVTVAEYSPSKNRSTVYTYRDPKKICLSLARPGTLTLIIALIPQWFFQIRIMRIFASFLILNNPEQFL
jgi:hypothetical protein